MGGINGDSYGYIRIADGKNLSTHRLSYLAVKGEIPRGKVVRHTCDVRQCCNPDHLVIGDHEDNTQDIVDRKRHGRRRSLDEAEREAVRQMWEGGATKRAIAETLKCNWYTVSNAIDAIDNAPKRRGRPAGSRNLHVKVTEDMKAEMRQLYATGKYSQQELAERFGCDQTYVSLIVRGKK
jgi:Arc/MetJ-type ribon-helix-helix transcriptional regulator